MQLRFVDLDRYLVPVKAEPGFGDDSSYWGKRYGGWMRWSQLLTNRRIVILAGAGNGKTEEFKHQTRVQRDLGRAAFFVRLEDLADIPFADAIDHQLSSTFSTWLNGSEPGWFFLDAVDELKLRGKRLDTALRAVAKALHHALGRAHIVISSRPTDWDWRTDPTSLADRLRPPEPTPIQAEIDRDEALMGPFLEQRTRQADPKTEERSPFEIRTFRLALLDQEQVRELAEANEVMPAKPFLDAIAANNLESLTQTPLDVDVLIGYWKAHGKLDRLAQMVEYVVDRKLVEREPNRPDGNLLGREEARTGAERIAAALTFGKALSVRFSHDDAHATIEESSPDIADILPEWTEAKRAALLRRGVFAPATFGRVRFHHRQTQDFLTACWLERLMRDGHGNGAILRLGFPEIYGEKTVVPSLVQALSWLALRQPDVREALLERQPLALVQGGDPSSLAIDDKRKVLQRYAALHSTGKVSNDMIWGRQLALFADAGLAETIRGIWAAAPADDVCFQLMRIVGEARIVACADLCAEVAFNASAADYHRIIAVQALARCQATTHLTQLAKKVLNECTSMSEHVCCGIALELFPRHLEAKQLASIIDRTPRSKELRTDGFANKLEEFLAACRNVDDKRALLGELVCLCRHKPHSQDYERVSAKHKKIAEHLGPLVRDAIHRLGQGERPAAILVRALGVMQWVDDKEGRDEEERLAQLVRHNIALNRALYWHSVIEDRLQKPDRAKDHWQRLPWRSRRQFWSFIGEDWSWLVAELKAARRVENRRAALVAAHLLLIRNEAPQDAVEQIRAAIGDNPVLNSALNELLTPRQQEDWEREHARDQRRWQCKTKIREIRRERNWKAFRDRLGANPTALMDPRRIVSNENVRTLHALTDWLAKPKCYLARDVNTDWRRLALPFGLTVAEAYCDGMRLLWRQAAPARPTRSEGGGISTPWLNTLAFHAVLMESREIVDWPANLSDAEAECAAGHLVLTEQGITDELIDLASVRPDAALRILVPALKQEWTEQNSTRQLLYHIAHDPDGLRPLLAPLVLDLVLDDAPEHLDVYDLAIEIVRSMELDDTSSERLRSIAMRRFKAVRKTGNEEGVIRALALLFLVDPADAMRATRQWLGPVSSRDHTLRAERLFAALFGRDRALVTVRLATLPVGLIEQLYRLCHASIKPEHDRDRTGGASAPNERDRAEDARNGFLNAIVNRSGRPSYDVLRRLGHDQLWGKRSHRAFELARERAEKDGDLSAPWTPKETIEFERKRLAPIETGDDLVSVICEVLSDIQVGFERDDATSRDLLALAPDEDHVQNWFTEQLNLRSYGRFHAFREPRVADKKRCDVIVASTSCSAQLAVEIKHGGKGWSVRTVEHALTSQLSGRYLKPENRRHGILLVTNHGRRYWRCPDTGRRLSLEDLLGRLNHLGQVHCQNVQVITIGLDVTASKRKAVFQARATDKSNPDMSSKKSGAVRRHRKRGDSTRSAM